MIKMRNVGVQTQKKWRPGGPPLEGRGGPKGGARRNVRGPRGGVGVRRVGARRVGHRSVGARRRWAQNFALFFHSPATIFFLSSLSWGSSRGNLVFWSAGTLKCAHLEFSGCRVKPRRPQRAKMGSGEGKKNAKFWAVRRRWSGGGGSGAGVPGRGSGAGGVQWRNWKKNKKSKHLKNNKTMCRNTKILKKGEIKKKHTI